MNSENKILFEKALESYYKAYAPYSKFSVGAAILADDGNIITGCNVEIASYGLTICAERNAIFNAYNQGYRKENLVKILITGNTPKPISPCGACRQVISELLSDNAVVILTNINGDMIEFTKDGLLPYGFTEGDLNDK